MKSKNTALLLGNEAIARGAWEAGCHLVSSYPGTPSTEITEVCAEYPEMHTEWATNEKVALEVAVGASFGGARAMSCMKHVGLNVAADPLFTAAYTGVNGGLVVCVADDPGMHSSQNEQDSRFYARAAMLPMMEPSDSAECLSFTKAAFELSERFDAPVLIRSTTRIAHARSQVTLQEREEAPIRPYEKNPTKYVMMPAMARGRHLVVEQRTNALKEYVETCPFNKIEMRDDLKVGVICSGIAYQYVREALPEASILKLGIVNPIPEKAIRAFAAKVDTLYVLEELEPVIEEQVKAMGIDAIGKQLTGHQGELSVNRIKKMFDEPIPTYAAPESLPGRPPVMCAGCPHRGPFSVLSKRKMHVMGDIGCYTLGALAPLTALDASLCMGASVGMAQGIGRAQGEQFGRDTVAVIGDSTFLHSGVTSLISAVYNKAPITLVILDNRITGMTGHQPNPASGKDIHGNDVPALDLAALCRACGVDRVVTVDAFDLDGFDKAVTQETAVNEPSVIIARQPCALLDKKSKKPALQIDQTKCRKCMACMKMGCPAIEKRDNGVVINESQCVGCGLCIQTCKFGAIGKAGERG
ncbi:indolepyruvate ferredoxin oxidoreductase subunit alpha [Eubacteriales bacterium OttesenSCG-928-N13]|nr:indolepyruvate ferredoxin oxidoreductase subunit alpha [Eubacteriales bacterium OttesenSCG-928-N13]